MKKEVLMSVVIVISFSCMQSGNPAEYVGNYDNNLVKVAHAESKDDIEMSLLSLVLEKEDDEIIEKANVINTFSGEVIENSIKNLNGFVVISLELPRKTTSFFRLTLIEEGEEVENLSLQATPSFELVTLRVIRGSSNLQILEDASNIEAVMTNQSEELYPMGTFWNGDNFMRATRIELMSEKAGSFTANHRCWQKQKKGLLQNKKLNLSTGDSIELLVETEEEIIEFLVSD